METTDPAVISVNPVHPRNSADWFFMLPMTSASKVLILGPECMDYTHYFDKLGIEASICESAIPDLTRTKLAPSSFDVVAAPHGFPHQTLAGNSLGLRGVFQDLHSLIKPGGSLLIGFTNYFWWHRPQSPPDFYSTPVLISHALHNSGFKSISLHGVVSNLAMPDYIFPISNQTIGFILEHRYSNRLPAFFVPWLHVPAFGALISQLLPAYFAIALASSNK